MWDSTWLPVEHEQLKKYTTDTVPNPFQCGHIINQEQLNEFNNQYMTNDEEIHIETLKQLKIDGALLCLSNNLPVPFIHPNLHFVREDYYAEKFFIKHNIPQLHISNILKGHNYCNPLKRINTNNKRTELSYKKFEQESVELIKKI